MYMCIWTWNVSGHGMYPDRIQKEREERHRMKNLQKKDPDVWTDDDIRSGAFQ